MFKRKLPVDYAQFFGLEIQKVSGRNGAEKIACHISGKLDDGRAPLICLADYYRNMSDFTELADRFHAIFDADWPLVLIDLAGRGRSDDRANKSSYTTGNDADDVINVAAMLGIERAIFLGQGHGGRVIMALGGLNPNLICASILIDSAPVLYAPGIVRLRDNLSTLLPLKNHKHFLIAARKIFTQTHPQATDKQIIQIIDRAFFRSKSGRYHALFDKALLSKLDNIEISDVFEPQWPLFATLNNAPMMLLRTQLSDQLERSTFEYMGNLRSDAVQLAIEGQGSPALLSSDDEVGSIADFVQHSSKLSGCRTIVSG
ncbi:MAG: alpha/beta fold hydrolase [Devosiaceae bacterium]|nr:alpha/beta fold hydrolase [Devosiaceae bacterium]